MIGSAAMTIFAQTTTTTSRFKLEDMCRSEKWEVYLYGDMTIKVMGSRRAENCGFPQLQFSALRGAVHGVMGRLFWGRVHRYTARGDPRHHGGDIGSLLPGVLPPN